MAIAEMKKLTLLGLKKDKPRIMTAMQHLKCVQVIQEDVELPEESDTASQSHLADLQKDIARLDLTIARLSPYDKEKRGMLSLPPKAGEEDVARVEEGYQDIMRVVERMEEIERTRGELRSEESREKGKIEQLTPWKALDMPVNRMDTTRTSLVWMADVPQKNLSALEQSLGEIGPAGLETIGTFRDTAQIVVAAHKSVQGALEDALRENGASRVQFEDMEGTPTEVIANLEGKLRIIDEKRADLQKETESLADNLSNLRLLRDVLVSERDRLEAGQRCVDTKSAFLLKGWVPADKTEKLEKAVQEVSSGVEIEFEDPAEDEQPPTLLRNKTLVSPFETIVQMFSTPDPRGLDPTAIMMPFWVCFFGMMVSDAGYGVVLGLGAAFVWWKLRDRGIGKMAFILAMGGLSTVIWGSIYGGWFGATPYKPVLDPMNDALKVLIVCVVIGFIHLVAGMLTAAYMSIKRGHPLDALFDQGFWLLILFGFALMVVNTTVGGIVALIGAVGVLCTAGRAKKNIIGKITGGLGALYGITGYLSDLLSYARLFGMGLATGVIGMVVNMLASLLWASPVGKVFAIVELLAMHTFNLFINALGAYVHSCRLQFIEFFGKFYESGGKDFKPLSNDTRYVDLP